LVVLESGRVGIVRIPSSFIFVNAIQRNRPPQEPHSQLVQWANYTPRRAFIWRPTLEGSLRSGYINACVPLWVPMILTVPTLWMLRHAHAQAPSACPACRYNRAGLPAAANCPECGEPAHA
jgi:hypothetical protein